MGEFIFRCFAEVWASRFSGNDRNYPVAMSSWVRESEVTIRFEPPSRIQLSGLVRRGILGRRGDFVGYDREREEDNLGPQGCFLCAGRKVKHSSAIGFEGFNNENLDVSQFCYRDLG